MRGRLFWNRTLQDLIVDMSYPIKMGEEPKSALHRLRQSDTSIFNLELNF